MVGFVIGNWWFTYPTDNFQYSYPYFNAFFCHSFSFQNILLFAKFKQCQRRNTGRQRMESDDT